MQIPFKELDTLKPGKCQDLYKINFQTKADYLKAKYLLSCLYIRWSANDHTRTIYFCGKKKKKG